MLIIIVLSFIIIVKSEKSKQLQSTIDHLRNSLDQMDEQAKLIVRTDLELSKVQDELDKKISEFYTLQSLLRDFSTTLDEKAIFNKIEPKHIEGLGMKKALAFTWQTKEKKLLPCLVIGYPSEDVHQITAEVESNPNGYLELIAQKRSFSSLSADTEFISSQEIKRIFKVNDFCISPFLPTEGNPGFILLGTNRENIITEGDEELITILAHTIGQALGNARLFETDIRARQDAEKTVEERTRELKDAMQELEKANKRKSNFVSAVSHELRTPLTSIKGYAAILLAKTLGEIPVAVAQRLEKINHHSDELVHMVNDLLDISRLESGKFTMKRQPCNLKELVDSIIDLLLVQIKNKDLNLSVDIPSNLEVMVDKNQVERVFVNLINNAIKFTPEKGKITLTIIPSAKDFVQVNISDTGIGIPKETQEAIFEEFYRVDNPINSKVKGTGLGLSLVKNIIEAHKGLIWVESRPGSGSTFSFLLPTGEDINKDNVSTKV